MTNTRTDLPDTVEVPEVEPQTVREERDWKPTKQMQRFIAQAKEANFLGKEVDWCKKARLAVSSFSKWSKRDPHFVRWFLKQADEHACLLLPHVYGKCFARAMGTAPKDQVGSWNDAKLLFERFDSNYVPRQKTMMAAAISMGEARAQDMVILDELLQDIARKVDGEE